MSVGSSLISSAEKTAEKLREAGFADMMRLATATAKELSVKAEIGEGVAEKVIEAARRAEKIDFERVSAEIISAYEKKLPEKSMFEK